MLQAVSLQEMLDFREKKVFRQEQLQKQYTGMTLISLMMNIPGPYKTSPAIQKAFQAGCECIERSLSDQKWLGQAKEKVIEKAGYIAYFVVASPKAVEIKKAMIDIEETHPYGKLFDIDVYGADGKSVSRTTLGKKERTCLICDEKAKVCARSRAHSLEALQQKVDQLLNQK